MPISLNMVRELLSDVVAGGLPEAPREPIGTVWFDTLFLLPEKRPDSLPENALYISSAGRLEEYAHLLTAGHYVLSLRDAGAPGPAGGARCGILEADDSADPADVINRLQNELHKVNLWIAALDKIISARGDIQELLDVSERMFKNPIVAINRSLTPIAFTRGTPFKHPDLIEMSETGRFPYSTVTGLYASEDIARLEEYDELGFFPPPNYFKETMIVKKFRPNPVRLNTLQLHAENSELSLADYDKMLLLSEKLERHVLGFAWQPTTFRHRDINFLVDILDGGTDYNELVSKAALTKLPPDYNYRIYCISFEDNIESRANYLVNDFQRGFESAYVFLYRSEIVIMLREQKDSVGPDGFFERILAVLGSHKAYCGCSRVASGILLARDALVQARAATELGKLLSPGRRVFSYDDYYVYHMIRCASREISLKLLYDKSLDAVIESDRTKGLNNLRLLEVYLDNSRNITNTAKAMNLHRNSVLYRLERLERLLGVDLNDPEARLRLILSIKALKLRERLSPS